jgi:hypothetical protein
MRRTCSTSMAGRRRRRSRPRRRPARRSVPAAATRSTMTRSRSPSSSGSRATVPSGGLAAWRGLGGERYDPERLWCFCGEAIAYLAFRGERRSGALRSSRYLIATLGELPGSTLQGRWDAFERDRWPRWVAGVDRPPGTHWPHGARTLQIGRGCAQRPRGAGPHRALRVPAGVAAGRRPVPLGARAAGRGDRRRQLGLARLSAHGAHAGAAADVPPRLRPPRPDHRGRSARDPRPPPGRRRGRWRAVPAGDL